jgi:dolichyl-phosphate-mannose-protein mannosyltransferase
MKMNISKNTVKLTLHINISKNTVIVLTHALLILFTSYCTYFCNYWSPPALFWDENYHIASAYKYLHQVMFMEPHPPLGKLLIALGEYLFHPNQHLNTTSFLSTDFITTLPAGFSFVGVRFFPVLLATLSAGLFFSILYQISKDSFIAFLFSSLYLFDNALIVQSRGAMLEGIQIFFVLAALLCFLLLLDRKKSMHLPYFVLGLLVGLAISVKLNGAILLLLFFPLFLYQQSYLPAKIMISKLLLQGRSDNAQLPDTTPTKIMISKLLLQALLFLSGSALVFGDVYYVHAMLSQQVVGNRYYAVSNVYVQVLADKQSSDLIYFPIIFRDNLHYINLYESRVPKYNPKDPNDNGSYPYTWPFGNKTIRYRWEKANGQAKYLYLVGNPVIWFAGLVGIVSAIGLVITTLVFRRPITNKKLFFIMVVLLALYILYMCSVLPIQRVLYLYLYFIPLIFSLLLMFIVYVYIFEKAIQRRDKRLLIGTVLFVLLIILTYFFFSPLTYYQPLTKDQFLMRSWFSFWHMKPV